ncbi:hypothetical protein HanLR1_Chr17g0685051 [Helianthus annuus]|nr:hypothetical protein HanLR1_Chr17g0685051 [Helianthus annuus]
MSLIDRQIGLTSLVRKMPNIILFIYLFFFLNYNLPYYTRDYIRLNNTQSDFKEQNLRTTREHISICNRFRYHINQ